MGQGVAAVVGYLLDKALNVLLAELMYQFPRALNLPKDTLVSFLAISQDHLSVQDDDKFDIDLDGPLFCLAGA